MGAIGEIKVMWISAYSITSVLRRGLGFPYFVVLIGALSCLILTCLAIVDPSLGAGLLNGGFSLSGHPTLLQVWAGALAFVGGARVCGCVWWANNRLRCILLPFNRDAAFEPGNVKRLQSVGSALLGVQIVNLAINAGAALGGGAFSRPIDGAAWLAIPFIFILAEVFRQGSVRREDRQITI